MLAKIIDVTYPSCQKKNLLFKRSTKETNRCDHCQSQFSDPSISSTLQIKSALKARKIISFSVLISIGLLVFSVRSVLAGSQSLPISSAAVTSQPKTVPNPPIVIAKNRSLSANAVLVSQAIGGTLKVSNGTNRDAYVKLVDPHSRILVAAFFVKSNSTYMLEGITDGSYQVLFVLGNRWNPRTQSFTQNKRFAKFDKFLNYTTMQLSDGIQYRAFEITLNPVAGGNARTSRVNEREFNRY